MKHFANLSISGKILSIVVLATATELLMCFVAMYFLSGLNAYVQEIVTVQAEEIKLGGRVKARLLEIMLAEKNLILSETQEERKIFERRIEGKKTEVEQGLNQLREIMHDAKQEAALDEVAANW